jgi:arylsulfatase A-like enzyme
MACLDEGVGNLTRTYQSLSIWEDTLVVLAADNGGHVGSSGNNAPLCVQSLQHHVYAQLSLVEYKIMQTNSHNCC